MSNSEAAVCKLKVDEGMGKDVGRCFARIDPEDMEKLQVAIGDIVEVRGKHTTVCKVMPAYKEQRGHSRVQLDGTCRENAGTALDELVEVRKVVCRPAERIVIAPLNIVLPTAI